MRLPGTGAAGASVGILRQVSASGVSPRVAQAAAITGVLLLSMVAAPAGAQGGGGGEIVERWFRLLEDLGTGAEGRDQFLSLYAVDALHIQGPSGSHQRGTTTFRGREKVGMLVDRLLEEWENHSIRIEVATAAEVSKTLLPEIGGPWGGPLVAAQFSLAATRRDTGVRWHVPGSAFFRIVGAELTRVRIYLGLGEAAEVEIQR